MQLRSSQFPCETLHLPLHYCMGSDWVFWEGTVICSVQYVHCHGTATGELLSKKLPCSDVDAATQATC